jgi:hypothetical protein
MAKRNIKITFGLGDRKRMITIASKIAKKHTDSGEESPLKTINMAAFSSIFKLSSDKNAQMEDLQLRYEQTKAETDLALGIAKGQTMATPDTLLFFLGLIRDQLMVTYKGREELIEDWGFEVTVTESKGMKPREPKKPTT